MVNENQSQVNPVSPGLYNIEYYSGAQCAVYIGEVLVDEVTSISFEVQQSKRPLFGYADQLFRDVSKGQVFVQGQFTINFKEAGYLWLILHRYRSTIANKPHPFFKFKDEATGKDQDSAQRFNIERIIDNDLSSIDLRNDALSTLAASAALTGFPGGGRSSDVGATLGIAESEFEQFEDAIWGPIGKNIPEEPHRRADDSLLNPFDIYLAYGDFAGDNRNNHTIRKIEGVHIIGTAQRIEIDGMPISEQYSFIARNLV